MNRDFPEELCDYCGTPGASYVLVHGHRCSNDPISRAANLFQNSLAVMMGGEAKEKRFVVHEECVKSIFVGRSIRMGVKKYEDK